MTWNPEPRSYIRRLAGSGAQYGSTNTLVLLWATAAQSAGGDIVFTASAANGDSFRVTKGGLYAVSISLVFAAADFVEIQVGSSILNTTDNVNTRARQYYAAIGVNNAFGWTGYAAASDYIYAVVASSTNLGAARAYDRQITVAQIW